MDHLNGQMTHSRNRNCPATAPDTMSTIVAHLLVNLYRIANVIAKITAAIPDCAALRIASSTGLITKSRSAPWMLDLRIWKLITAITPMTAPQSPSKKLARNLQEC